MWHVSYTNKSIYRTLTETVTDGVTRMGATLSQELRNAVFASVAQKAIRKVACSVYEHLLKLDLSFHLTRQTGGLTRAIDRGTKGISFLLTSMVFHVLPTALEITLVCGILVRSNKFLRSTHTDSLDLPIRLAIRPHYLPNHDRLLRLHHPHHVVAHKVSQASQRRRQ